MRKHLEVEYGIHISMMLPKMSTRNKPKRNERYSEEQAEYKTY